MNTVWYLGMAIVSCLSRCPNFRELSQLNKCCKDSNVAIRECQ